MKNWTRGFSREPQEPLRSRNNQSDHLGFAKADASSEGKTEEANQGCIWNKNQMSRQYYEANPNWYVRKDIHDEVVAENANLKEQVKRIERLESTVRVIADIFGERVDKHFYYKINRVLEGGQP